MIKHVQLKIFINQLPSIKADGARHNMTTLVLFIGTQTQFVFKLLNLEMKMERALCSQIIKWELIF